MRMISRRYPGAKSHRGSRKQPDKAGLDQCPVAEERLSGSLAVSEFSVSPVFSPGSVG